MRFSKKISSIFFAYLIVFPFLTGIYSLSVLKSYTQSLASILSSFTSIPFESVHFLQYEFSLLLIFLSSLLPLIFFLRIKISRAPGLVLASASVMVVASVVVFAFTQTMIPLLDMLFALFLGTCTAIVLKMIFSSTEQEFLRIAFSQFVSEDMLKSLLKDPRQLSLQGKELPITVMFIDIRGFTTFSEHNSATLVVSRLNELLDKVTHVIMKHNGTVDKYMGDAVMAFWGAPNADKKQATHAVEAAKEIRKKIFEETEFKVGIGINHGMAIVGNMGSSKRFDYTVIGDTVNTGARLESATKDVGQTILIAESVMQKLIEEKHMIEATDQGTISVKGKQQGIHVFSINS